MLPTDVLENVWNTYEQNIAIMCFTILGNDLNNKRNYIFSILGPH